MEKRENSKDVITIQKSTIRKALKIFFYIYIFAFSILMIISHFEQSKEIESLTESINSIATSDTTSSEESFDITSTSYYKDYELDNSLEVATTAGKDFMIYFHSTECPYCLQANVYLNQYITLGYQEYVPIYFATADSSSELFESDMFGIESTPTIAYFDVEQEAYTMYEGADEILNVLNNLVSEANNE